MAKSISGTEKRTRGRPATNPTSIHLTLAPGPLAEVDRWIERQKVPPSRPEAIRRLVEIGLKARNDCVLPRIRWTLEEDERLLGLIAAGKSWTFISAALRRDTNSCTRERSEGPPAKTNGNP